METKKAEMPLATIENGLDFLQEAYAQYYELNEVNRAIVLEYNEEIQRSIKEENFNGVPLRILYIDLVMHDTMIRHSQNAHDRNEKRIRTLIKNKVAIQQMIQKREKALETITPDPRVEEAAGVANYDQLRSIFLSWCGKKQQSKLDKKLCKLWKQLDTSDPKWTKQCIQEVQKIFILAGLRTIEDFRSLFSIVECLLIIQMKHLSIESS